MSKQNLLAKNPFDPSIYAERVNALLARMTVAEKVGQLHLEHVADCGSLTDYNLGDRADENSVVDKVRRGAVGTMLIHGLEATNTVQKIAVEESRLGIPLLFGFDVVHGHKTVFPIPLGEAATWDPDRLAEAEAVAAKEAYADGLNWVYAPMIDLCRDPRWGRVAEGAGEDPLLGSLIAQAKVRGLQTINPDTGYPYVAACFKHYCGYGLAQGGRDYEECDASPRTVFMDYMKPYAAAIDAGALSAMSSFNVLNGQVITGSRYYLTEILRGKLGFGGFVVSDYGAVKELIHHRVAKDRKDAAGLAITAGVDSDMGSHVYEENLESLYSEDPRFAEAIDEAVRRILSVKFAMGLFEHPYHEPDCAEKFVLTPQSRELARDIARHCCVLLKNEDNILPLSPSKRYFLTGPLSDNQEDMPGAWAVYDPETNVITVKKAMEEAGYDFVHYDGCPFTGKYCFQDTDESDFSQALKLAEECDEIIYVCGERAPWSGENRGRVSLDLPKLQYQYLRALKATGKKIISVLMCGRAMCCSELDQASDALLLSWHLGTEAGHAICDVLSGDHCPSGRLPITFPYYTGQVPYYHAWLSSGRSRESLPRYKDGENKPLYPFGYGLSYADIECSNVCLRETCIAADQMLHVSVTLTNHSHIPAYEVVQAYFQDVVSSLATPERKLCGFIKVLVPANSSVEATLDIPAERFALMTMDLKEVVEPGEFLLFVGHDSTCQESISFRVE